MKIESIIAPVHKSLLKMELTEERFLRPTNKGRNEIYIIDSANSPNIMWEIGRLREIAFRASGGGTGKSADIDEFDTMDEPCQQLIVWNPEAEEIIGGYRFLLGENMSYDNDGTPHIAMSHMFRYSDKFLKEYLPYTIELGRSFVSVDYQSTKAGAKALYALDNLWDGLGALTVVYPQIKYLFGKMTMYPSYPVECRDMILYFLDKYFHDDESLVQPIQPLETNINVKKMQRLFVGDNFKDDYRILNTSVRAKGMNIPPLVNSYMNLSPKMKLFGTAINDEFGDVEETGIFFSISDIYEDKKMRHIRTFYQRFIEYRQEMIHRIKEYAKSKTNNFN